MMRVNKYDQHENVFDLELACSDDKHRDDGWIQIVLPILISQNPDCEFVFGFDHTGHPSGFDFEDLKHVAGVLSRLGKQLVMYGGNDRLRKGVRGRVIGYTFIEASNFEDAVEKLRQVKAET